MVAHEIQSFGRPFVIAFDELEELTDPTCAALIGLLLRRGPANLHLAFAGRELPASLNVAGPALDGHADILDTEDLRFARVEVSGFFDHRLSRRALAREARRSAGWPLALRVSRNSGIAATESAVYADEVIANWIESCLFAGVAADDRNLVLDLGLFDWMDEELLEDVIPSADALRRVQSLGVLDGLLEPVQAGGGQSWRLHSLIREHCAAQRFLEDAERARAIHREIAGPLARRGKIVAGMRHALAGGDPHLAGRIFEQAGGIRLWLAHGVAQFRQANDLLTDAVVAGSPRLRLARCVALVLAGHHHEARTHYAECALAMAPTEGATATNFAVQVEDVVMRGAFGVYGGGSVDLSWLRAVLADGEDICRSPEVDASTRGQLEYSHSVFHFIMAEFDTAAAKLRAARELLPQSRYIEFYGNLLQAQIGFVRGRLTDAEAHFGKARRVAREHLLLDPVAMLSCEVARREFALERDPAAVDEPEGILRVLTENGMPFSGFATALSLFVQARLLSGRADEIASVTDRMLVRVRAAGMAAYERLLVAARVWALCEAGHPEEAECGWRLASLPTTSRACVHDEALSLREIESVSEARARLLIQTRRHDEARDLLREYGAMARQRAFRRTELRALALAVGLEHDAGDREASQRHVARYVRLFAESPYALPMVLGRSNCEEPLRRLIATDPNAPDDRNARLLLAHMRRAGERSGLSLTHRERQVLRLLPGNTVKSMAASLGLTVHGVRHHLRNLFTKLDVSNRGDLLHRASELGLAGKD